jgi:hypothetical protein
VEIKEALSCGKIPQRIFWNVVQPAASSDSRIPVFKSSMAVIYILEIIPMEHTDCVTTPQNGPGPVTRIHTRAQMSAGIVRINRMSARKNMATGLGTMFVEARKLTGIARIAPMIVPSTAIAIVCKSKNGIPLSLISKIREILGCNRPFIRPFATFNPESVNPVKCRD